MKFEFLEHTADIKFKAYGKTLNGVYESCALAFSDSIARGNKIKCKKKKKVEVLGNDKEAMLYSFIEELIYLLDADDFVVAKAKVSVKGKRLNAEIFGDDSKNYKELDHVKAATYAEMYVKKTSKGWEAQMVLDV